MGKEILWKGEKNRPLGVYRPCSCGCDDAANGVGYLSGSDSKGNGFTIWIENEKNFLQISNQFNFQKNIFKKMKKGLISQT